jgi:glycosyltransferase involved in cell wall biosynthesis
MIYKVLLFIADQAGCGHARIFSPAKFLKKEFPNEFDTESSQIMNPSEWVTLIDKEKNLYQKNYHLVVHQRQYGAPNLQNFRYLREKLKIPCVYEIDDYLHGVHPLSSAYFAYNERTQKERFANIESYLKESDAVTVTTDYLKSMYSIYNKNIYVLPNYLDFEEIYTDEIRKLREQHRLEHESKNEIWLGWAGSNTHLPDLQQASYAIVNILREFPNVKLALGGWDGLFRDKENKIHHPELNPWKDVPEDRKVIIPWAKDMKDYPKMLCQFDIGIAPLEDTHFNRSKSDIKFKEYAASGVPCIASSVEPYANSIKDGEIGLLVKSKGSVTDSWYKKIKSLIVNKELRLKIAENTTKNAIENFDMQKNVYKWRDTYKEIIEKSIK